jgi:hypothetical protein
MDTEVQSHVSEAVMMQIEVHSSVAEASEESHDNAQLRQSFSGPKFQACNFQICGRNVNHSISMCFSSHFVEWNRTSDTNPNYQFQDF